LRRNTQAVRVSGDVVKEAALAFIGEPFHQSAIPDDDESARLKVACRRGKAGLLQNLFENRQRDIPVQKAPDRATVDQ
jgi:hypothetical protein